MDGSSKFFVEAIEKAGVIEQDAERKYYVVKEVISFTDEATGSEILLMPSDEYQVTTMVDFGTKVLGTQNATMKSIAEFKTEIADARTFSFLHELETLLDNGEKGDNLTVPSGLSRYPNNGMWGILSWLAILIIIGSFIWGTVEMENW
jgi:UDP-3-O-acyl-N-acetylglucosamine deacetylase